MLKNITLTDINITLLLIYSFATAKIILMIRALKLPEAMLSIGSQTENNFIRIILAQIGLFFDCPLCLSLPAAFIVLVLLKYDWIVLCLALSVIGLIIKKKFAL
jgi:hypothetical protein